MVIHFLFLIAYSYSRLNHVPASHFHLYCPSLISTPTCLTLMLILKLTFILICIPESPVQLINQRWSPLIQDVVGYRCALNWQGHSDSVVHWVFFKKWYSHPGLGSLKVREGPAIHSFSSHQELKLTMFGPAFVTHGVLGENSLVIRWWFSKIPLSVLSYFSCSCSASCNQQLGSILTQ